ncbi:MAG TPA: PHB depolymerase family esterase, partial [Saprospiraceae bacterium]|nr:PHB depolymerase family esterase [Saprospiraceae bacterium]
MIRILSVICCLSVAFTLPAQTTLTGTIQSGGLTREYRLYKPAVYNGSTAVPLVINMHGYSSNNLEQEFYGDFRGIADTANFLIVHPNGTLDNQGQRFWNAFGTGSNVDDVGFISDLIDTLSAAYNIDPQRIYATGMSNGGFMSYSLACELNERIAAIASVTGSMAPIKLASCNPQRPVPVMEIHGTADGVVPYTGQQLTMVAIPDLVSAWAAFNNCNPTPVVTSVPNTNTGDGCTAERFVYSGGDAGSTVEHYKIIGGGHTWPGAAFIIGVTNQDFKASQEIWRFFSKYDLNGSTTGVTTPSSAGDWTATPNPAGDFLLLQSAAQQPVQRIQVWDAAGKLYRTVQPAAAG